MEIVHRDLEDEIEKYIGRREIIIIRGPRQAGKTTLMKAIEEKTKGPKKFINFENVQIRREFEESPLSFVERYSETGKATFFMDEVQHVERGGEKLKLLFDDAKGLKIFASGSSSLEMRTNVLHALAGRALLFELMTFSFGEYVDSVDKGLYRIYEGLHRSVLEFVENGKNPPKPAFSDELLGLWKEYAVYGGYPEIAKERRNESAQRKILGDILSLYIDKDVVSFFRIEDSNKFIDFSRAMAFNVGDLLKLSSTAADISITAYRAQKFLDVLSNSYVVAAVYPFYKNIVTEIKKAPKIYFWDLGMRNSVLGNFVKFDDRDDRGKLAKNFVFRELHTAGYSPRYWRTLGNAEMDFVITDSANKIVPIEVKLGGSKALGKSFYSFVEAYKPERALVATLGEFEERVIGNTKVLFIPIFYL